MRPLSKSLSPNFRSKRRCWRPTGGGSSSHHCRLYEIVRGIIRSKAAPNNYRIDRVRGDPSVIARSPCDEAIQRPQHARASNPDGRTAAPGLTDRELAHLFLRVALVRPWGRRSGIGSGVCTPLNRLAIRRRREPHHPTEQAVHVALVRKPAVGGDALERNVLAGELPFGVLEPSLDDVGMRRAAKVHAKFSSKVETAQLDQVCELGQGDVALDVF